MGRQGYFDPEESIAYQSGENIMHTLITIGSRYIGASPPHPPVYRVSRPGPVRKSDDHRYRFPIGEMFSDMRKGQKVYAWAKLWSNREQEFIFHVTCFGPIRVYHNGLVAYGSSSDEEYPVVPLLKLKCRLNKGWNYFVLEFSRGQHGSGGVFGTGSKKINLFISLYLLTSGRERKVGYTPNPLMFRCFIFLRVP